jgi:hypothetical protein
MAYDGIEPLEPETWLAQLKTLAQRPTDGEAFARSLRLAFHLARLTPAPLRHVVGCRISEAKFEALLEAGSFAEASLALLGDQMGYTVSRLPGAALATAEVFFPDDAQGCRATGSDAASALLAAWLGRLGSLDEDTPGLDAILPGRRRDQSERRPKSTEH